MADPSVWPAIHEQHTALADSLDGLSVEQWETQSLCQGWQVRDVVAHLISTARMTKGAFFAGFAGSGFRFHAFSQKAIARSAGKTPEQLIAEVRATAPLSGRRRAAPRRRGA